jgi:uncharacterized membrane protein
VTETRGPLDIVVAVWPDADEASVVMREFKSADKGYIPRIVDVATLVVDDEGKLRITETQDMRPKKGAVVGGLVGAGVGLLTGGVGWLVLGGGALGAMAAKARDSGVPDARLQEIGESLKPNSSAIVVVIEHASLAELKSDLTGAGAEVASETVSGELAERLGGTTPIEDVTPEAETNIVAVRATAPDTIQLDAETPTTARA